MVARRRVLNEARAVTRSGYVVSRKDEMAVERTGGVRMVEADLNYWVE